VSRDGFTFFRSFYESAVELPDDQRLAFYDALISFGLDGIEPPVSGIAKSLFVLVRPILAKSAVRAKAGSQGGRPSKKASRNQAESKMKPKLKQTETHRSEDFGYRTKDMDKEMDYGHSMTDGEKDTVKNIGMGPAISSKSNVLEKRFAEFWAAYPLKVGKKAAVKAWGKITPDAALHEQILSAVEQQKQGDQWKRDNGQYIPHPTTWLNQGRWDDEVTPKGSGQHGNNEDKPFKLTGFADGTARFRDNDE